MADLTLSGYDLSLVDGDLPWIDGLDAVAQDCAMTLRTFLEETPYDRSAGVPYLQVIFQRGVSLYQARFILTEILLAVDLVDAVLELDLDLDTTARTLAVTGRLQALDSEFPINVTVNP